MGLLTAEERGHALHRRGALRGDERRPDLDKRVEPAEGQQVCVRGLHGVFAVHKVHADRTCVVRQAGEDTVVAWQDLRPGRSERVLPDLAGDLQEFLLARRRAAGHAQARPRLTCDDWLALCDNAALLDQPQPGMRCRVVDAGDNPEDQGLEGTIEQFARGALFADGEERLVVRLDPKKGDPPGRNLVWPYLSEQLFVPAVVLTPHRARELFRALSEAGTLTDGEDPPPLDCLVVQVAKAKKVALGRVFAQVAAGLKLSRVDCGPAPLVPGAKFRAGPATAPHHPAPRPVPPAPCPDLAYNDKVQIASLLASPGFGYDKTGKVKNTVRLPNQGRMRMLKQALAAEGPARDASGFAGFPSPPPQLSPEALRIVTSALGPAPDAPTARGFGARTGHARSGSHFAAPPRASHASRSTPPKPHALGDVHW